MHLELGEMFLKHDQKIKCVSFKKKEVFVYACSLEIWR